MFNLEKRAQYLSDQYYNRGLDRAKIRDLSGAVDMLRRSLQLNKHNVRARNLLGLVYFEMGEAVSALSEWVISKNMHPDDPLAESYIRQLQNDQKHLSAINQSIRDYNAALENCRMGNEDVAAVSLRKVVSENPHFIKALHLLSLIYIEQKRYKRARRLLRRALRIDHTNPTTLRYLQAVDEATGTVTRLEGGIGNEGTDDQAAQRMQVVNYRTGVLRTGFFNIILGILIGALAAWFIIAPSVNRNVEADANNKVVEYSNTMASQKDQISQLNTKIKSSQDTVNSAQKKIDDAEKKAEAYENLMKAFKAYQGGDYSTASEACASVERSLLSADAKVTYDEIYDNVKGITFSSLQSDGIQAYKNGNYSEAISKLEAARKIKSGNYLVLDYLALSYKAADNKDKAIEIFQEIVVKFPGTRRASRAKNSIEALGGTVDSGNEDTGTEDAAGTDTTGNGDTESNAG